MNSREIIFSSAYPQLICVTMFPFSFIPTVNDLTSDLFHTKSKSEEINLELGKLGKNLTATLVLEKCLRE